MSSIPLLATNTTVLCRVVKALYDAAPGYTYLQNFLSYANANGINATVNALATNFASQSNAQLAVTVCTNLGLTGTAYTAGVAYLTAQFNASTTASRGVVISDAMTALSALSSDATFGTVASAFNSSVAVSEAYSTNSANTSTDLSTLQGADDIASSTNFTLTNATETTTGTTGNDVFTGTLGTTLQNGDIVQGRAGSDSLTILANATNDTGRIAFEANSVETIGIRLLASAALNATSWSGTTTIQVLDTSASGTTVLNVNNVDLTDQIVLSKGSYLVLDALDDTSSTDSWNIEVTPGASASYTIDTSAAAVTTLNLTVSGSQTITGEVTYLGSSTTAYSVSGQGRVVLDLDNNESNVSISSISYAGFSGTSRTLVSSTSQLSFTGGTGNDKLTLAGEGTLTTADTLVGGAGTDTLVLNLDNLAASAFQSVSGFEELEGTLVSSSVDTGQVSGFSQLTFKQGTAATDIYVSGLGNATVDLNLQTGRNVRLGFSGASVANIDLNYASGGSDLGAAGGSRLDLNVLKVSGIASVDIDFGAVGTATDIAFGSFLSVEDATTVSLDVSRSATVSATTFAATGAVSVTLLASGDGAILSLGSANNNNMTGLSVLNVTTVGSSIIGLGTLSGLADSSVVTVNVGSSGVVTLRGLGNASNRDGGDGQVSVNVSQSAQFAGGGDIQLRSGTLSLNLVVGKDSNADVGNLGAGGSGTVSSLVVTAAEGASADIGTVSGAIISGITGRVGNSGVLVLGEVDGSSISNISMELGVSASLSIAVGSTISANSTLGNVLVSGGNYASAQMGGLFAGTSMGTITLVLGDGGDLTLAEVNQRGTAAGSIGNIALTGASGSDFALSKVSAQGSLGSVNVTLSDRAVASAIDLISHSASIGSLTISVGSAAKFFSNNVSADTTVGDISITGSGGSANITHLAASADMGTITVAGSASFSALGVDASGLGGISITSGGSSTIRGISAISVGEVRVTGSGSLIKFDSAAAAFNIADITVRGSGGTIIDLGNASSVGTINFTGHAGTATVDASLTNSGITVTLGASANTVVLSSASDSLTFRNGTGFDKVYFTSTGRADDFGRYFQIGTSTDGIYFSTGDMVLGLGSSNTTRNSAGALDIVIASAGVKTLVVANSATVATGNFDSATDMVIFADSAFANAAAMVSDLKVFTSAGVNDTINGGSVTAGSLLVLWYDSTNSRTELTLVNVAATAGVGAATIASAIAGGSQTALAYFDFNITTVSANGAQWDSFYTYGSKDIQLL